jgi:hypothetical protein
VLFIWPALYNGYPLLYPDTGTYIASGHSGIIPVDRPVFYGLFLRHISLSKSLWLLVIAQSALCNYLLYLLCSLFASAKQRIYLQTALLFLLGLWTSLPYYCSMLLPDIFTSVIVLSFVLLLLLPSQKKKHKILLSFLLAFSLLSHLSNIPLVLGLLVMSTVFFLFSGDKTARIKRLKKLLLPSMVLLATILTGAGWNSYSGAGFQLSRSSNLFIAARLIESGIARDHLKTQCPKESFNAPYADLCKYADEFDRWPTTGDYLFTSTSPLFQGGCLEEDWSVCWLEKEPAYAQLVKDIYTNSSLYPSLLEMIISGSIEQFFRFDVEELPPREALDYLIEWHFNDDWEAYRGARQNNGGIQFTGITVLEHGVFYFSWLILLLLSQWKQVPFKSRFLLFMVISTLAINATITATFSNVLDRYQGRIVYLLPLAAVVLLFSFYFNKSDLKKIKLAI